jgi:hypothetical protein
MYGCMFREYMLARDYILIEQLLMQVLLSLVSLEFMQFFLPRANCQYRS